jgi:hypothetical protein
VCVEIIPSGVILISMSGTCGQCRLGLESKHSFYDSLYVCPEYSLGWGAATVHGRKERGFKVSRGERREASKRAYTVGEGGKKRLTRSRKGQTRVRMREQRGGKRSRSERDKRTISKQGR